MRQTGARVPMRFEAAVVATRRVRSDSTAATASAGELARRGVEVDPADGGPGGLGHLHPRPDVGVVVEAGHDDLVARCPVLGQRPGEVVGERGRAPAEDDAAGVGAEQVAEGGAAVGDDGIRPPLRRGHRAAVGDGAGQGVGDRPPDDVGDLAAARAVEVGGALRERGEVGADRGDVERHTGILPQRPAPRVTTFPPDPGTFTSAPEHKGCEPEGSRSGREVGAGHQEVCSGRPSAKPAVLCRPTVARSWNSSSVRAPA